MRGCERHNQAFNLDITIAVVYYDVQNKDFIQVILCAVQLSLLIDMFCGVVVFPAHTVHSVCPSWLW